MRSSFDSKGMLFVACSECNRGGNGSDPDKCSSGWRVKKWNGLGCFMGDLLPKYEAEAAREKNAIVEKQN